MTTLEHAVAEECRRILLEEDEVEEYDRSVFLSGEEEAEEVEYNCSVFPSEEEERYMSCFHVCC